MGEQDPLSYSLFFSLFCHCMCAFSLPVSHTHLNLQRDTITLCQVSLSTAHHHLISFTFWMLSGGHSLSSWNTNTLKLLTSGLVPLHHQHIHYPKSAVTCSKERDLSSSVLALPLSATLACLYVLWTWLWEKKKKNACQNDHIFILYSAMKAWIVMQLKWQFGGKKWTQFSLFTHKKALKVM